MKKFFSNIGLIVLLLISTIGTAFSQNEMGNIRKLKVKIVLDEMHLTKTKEQKFLPLYTKYCDETLLLRKKIKSVDASNASPEEKITQRETYKQQILDIEKRYKEDFLKIITATELENMYRGEDKFRQTLLNLKKEK